jgi:hypothetical protein
MIGGSPLCQLWLSDHALLAGLYGVSAGSARGCGRQFSCLPMAVSTYLRAIVRVEEQRDHRGYEAHQAQAADPR